MRLQLSHSHIFCSRVHVNEYLCSHSGIGWFCNEFFPGIVSVFCTASSQLYCKTNCSYSRRPFCKNLDCGRLSRLERFSSCAEGVRGSWDDLCRCRNVSYAGVGGGPSLRGWLLHRRMVCVFNLRPYKIVPSVCLIFFLLIIDIISSSTVHSPLPSPPSRSVGESAACSVNRSSPYFLMVILLNLLYLLLQLLSKLKEGTKRVFDSTQLCVLISWGFPALLMAMAYTIEGDDAGSDHELLNIARHGFSCSMRFKNWMEEWLLLWAHFSWFENVYHIIDTLSILFFPVTRSAFCFVSPKDLHRHCHMHCSLLARNSRRLGTSYATSENFELFRKRKRCYLENENESEICRAQDSCENVQTCSVDWHLPNHQCDLHYLDFKLT
jgi:hypothetical protein